MKHLIAVIILIVTRVLGGDYPLAEDRKLVAEALGKEWVVTIDGDAIEIKSTFRIYWIGITSRVGERPEFSESTSRKELAKEAKAEAYVMRLEYGPRLDREELRRRIAERQKFAEILDLGPTPTKDAWQKAAEGFRKIRIPRYDRWTHDIYRVAPGSGWGCAQIYPPSAVGKIGAAKELLDAVIGGRYLNASE